MTYHTQTGNEKRPSTHSRGTLREGGVHTIRFSIISIHIKHPATTPLQMEEVEENIYIVIHITIYL
jgi:hypothetical protein